MSNDQWFIKITVKGYHLPPRCKKHKFLVEEIGRIDSMESVNLDEWTAKAREKIATLKDPRKFSLDFNKSKIDGEIVMVALIPEKSVAL